MTLLPTYVEGWRLAATAVIDLAPTLDERELDLPTDCPGWSVRDVIAHLAHLEHVLTQPPEPISDEVTVVSDYTEAGVEARRGTPIADVVDELRTAVEHRAAALETLPEDPSAPAPVTPGGVPWSWDTLLRNRCIDVWVHEQDIRRAIDRPGNLGSPGAHVVSHSFAAGMTYVLGKKVGALVGTSALWQVTGEVPFTVGAVIGDDGRAHRDDAIDDPDVTLTMSTEAFTVLAAGRRTPDQVAVDVEGDADLGARILAAMTLTF